MSKQATPLRRPPTVSPVSDETRLAALGAPFSEEPARRTAATIGVAADPIPAAAEPVQPAAVPEPPPVAQSAASERTIMPVQAAAQRTIQPWDALPVPEKKTYFLHHMPDDLRRKLQWAAMTDPKHKGRLANLVIELLTEGVDARLNQQ